LHKLSLVRLRADNIKPRYVTCVWLIFFILGWNIVLTSFCKYFFQFYFKLMSTISKDWRGFDLVHNLRLPMFLKPEQKLGLCEVWNKNWKKILAKTSKYNIPTRMKKDQPDASYIARFNIVSSQTNQTKLCAK